MTRLPSLITAVAILLALAAAPAAAQSQAQRGRLIVTVNDSTGGYLPAALVTIAGAEDATRAKIEPLRTTNTGIAIFDNLVPGRYTVVAEYSGFEKATPKETRVRTGDNRYTMVLTLARFTESVTVGRDQQEAGSDRVSTFGSMLLPSQIAELSDDPAIMRQQLEDLAGPGVTIAVDSFEGGQLPNKSQIRSIRISRDQFAAESHFAGGIRIDIVTQPGSGPIQGRFGTNVYSSRLDGTNPLVGVTPPTLNRSGNGGVSGGLLKDRLSFNLNVNGFNNYSTPVQAASAVSGSEAKVLAVRTRQTQKSVGAGFDWAVTKNQTVRAAVSRYASDNYDQGAGGFNARERTYTSGYDEWYVQGAHTGPIGRRMMFYNRFYYDAIDDFSKSNLEALTIVVPDDVTRGGAQQRGGTKTAAFAVNSDLDYVRGLHSFRMGLELTGSRYTTNRESNYLGTYYFESAAAYEAGLPRSFTRRVGDPNIRYNNVQGAIYFQDDIRISKTLTMTPGVRYELQNLVHDYNNLMPRYGVTWAPGAGKSTYRASLGMFYDWLGTGIYQQVLQSDGTHLFDVNMADPSYPDPGPLGTTTPVNKYLLADDVRLAKTARASLGWSSTINTRVSASAVYAFNRAIGTYVGENLNAPVNGVRPDPKFANVIQVVPDGKSRVQSLNTTLSVNLAGLGSNPLVGPVFQWRRGLRVSANYALSSARNNTDGAFAVPATELAQEWGPSGEDIRHRGGITFGSSAVKGVSSSISFNASSARPLTIRTGYDDNGDLIYNDRPVGVGRNSARVPGTWSSSASFGYTFNLGSRQVQSGTGVSITGGAGGAPTVSVSGGQAVARYRINLNVNISNLFNIAQWSGYSGVQTSANFLKPTSANGVRRITFNVGMTF
jgi:hypothetical protein